MATAAASITNVTKILPAFLRGDAFAVFANLPADRRASYEAISEALTTAFGMDEHVAFQELVTLRWREGEPVDVFVADLRRLASLAGVQERVVRMVLLNGLPGQVGMQIKTTPRIKTMTMDQVVTLARALMAAATGQWEQGMVQGAVRRPGFSGVDHAEVGAVVTEGRRLKCFGCLEEGHFIRNCPNAKARQRKDRKMARAATTETRNSSDGSGNEGGLS